MSNVTNVMLMIPSHYEHVRRETEPLDNIFDTMAALGCELDFREVSQHAGGNKNVEGSVYMCATRHAVDVEALRMAIRGANWNEGRGHGHDDKYHIQLLVMREDDERWRMIDVWPEDTEYQGKRT